MMQVLKSPSDPFNYIPGIYKHMCILGGESGEVHNTRVIMLV